MRTPSIALVTAALVSAALAALLSGCVVVARAPLPLVPVVYIDRAPPVAYNEVVTLAPGPGYVWIGGYQSWTGRDYVWTRGYWSLPARGYTHWNPGYWHRHNRGHYWVAGHWR